MMLPGNWNKLDFLGDCVWRQRQLWPQCGDTKWMIQGPICSPEKNWLNWSEGHRAETSRYCKVIPSTSMELDLGENCKLGAKGFSKAGKETRNS